MCIRSLSLILLDGYWIKNVIKFYEVFLVSVFWYYVFYEFLVCFNLYKDVFLVVRCVVMIIRIRGIVVFIYYYGRIVFVFINNYSFLIIVL